MEKEAREPTLKKVKIAVGPNNGPVAALDQNGGDIDPADIAENPELAQQTLRIVLQYGVTREDIGFQDRKEDDFKTLGRLQTTSHY